MTLFRHIAFISLLLTGCPLLAEQYYGVNITKQNLGQGFDSQLTMTRQHCVTGQWIETGNTQAELSYTGTNTVERHMQETFGKVKGGINLIIFAGSVSTSLSSKVTDNSRTASSSVSLMYDAKDLSLENRTLTPIGNSIQHQNDFTINNTCGNEFIQHVKLGSEIFVNARLHFRSVEEYQKWVTKIKVRFLFYSKTYTKTKEWKDLTENAIYQIEVVSRGGMTTQLNNILANNPTYCTTNNMDPCIDAANEIFTYLFSETGYAQDIKQEVGQVLSFSTSSYAQGGHFELDTGEIDKGKLFYFEEERLNSRLFTNQQLMESMKAYAAVESDTEQKELYLQKAQRAEENIQLLDTAAETCRMTTLYATCKQAVDLAVSELVVVGY